MATIIIFVGFPLLPSFWLNSLKSGLWFLATMAGKYNAFRNLDDPILEILLLPLTEVPDILCFGVNPA